MKNLELSRLHPLPERRGFSLALIKKPLKLNRLELSRNGLKVRLLDFKKPSRVNLKIHTLNYILML